MDSQKIEEVARRVRKVRVTVLYCSLCCSLALVGCTPSQNGDSTPKQPDDDTAPPDTERADDPFGRFEGEVVAVWNPDGRNMTLREDFAYVDPRKKRWPAPSDSVVNGASIPQVFWSIIGGPFEGPYRNASVIHDVACEQMKESWQSVHRMFYEACRCGGVGEAKAKLMYWAVYHFGPRWNEEKRPRLATRMVDGRVVRETTMVSRMVRDNPPPPDEELVEKAEAYFATQNPPLEEIPSLEF